nr:PREDICTED: E3 ubiquitin-protein ligase RNF169 [Anolis carolinensis]|eukprot:XP_003227522.1 PREDICTED: E3 ubiquitin-protein ligase RNF169 [Anolis carolinensis]
MAAALRVGVRAAPLLREGRRPRQAPPPRREGPEEQGEAPPPPPTLQPEREFIFRAPITLSKPGELREEYKSQLQKLRSDRFPEERTSEDLLHRLIVEEADAGRRKAEEQKKEESFAVRMTQEQFPECLSDSENEEPFQDKSAHRSAFVSKGSTFSGALLAGNLSSKVERSQSCNDTLQERSKSRQRSAPVRTKVNLLVSASTPLMGVLSSTWNSRCLSAPDLTADKRLVLGAATASSLFLLPKPERSISPESNDSISEELNHFKPIVCSPCTPPKRLPDGRVLSPLIIKSTPRNLTRSLQKPTTYEASPRILKKWEQIFQERQIKKTLSKATLTSIVPEMGEDFAVPRANSLIKDPPAESDRFPSKTDSSCSFRRGLGTGTAGPAKLNKNPLNARISETSDTKSALALAGSCLNIDAQMVPRKVIRVNATFPENGARGRSLKASRGKKKQQQLKYLNDSELTNFPNGLCLERAVGEDGPSLRRGRKRQCKMKHLEQAGSVKRLRQMACNAGLAAPDLLRRKRRRMERKAQQEEEDRRLALQLQRKFDSENRTVARQRGRADQYFLRSKSTTTGAK